MGIAVDDWRYIGCYIGCFQDDSDRDLEDGPGSNGRPHSVESCTVACSAYPYFALQNNGYYCFCGDAYSTEPQYYERTGCRVASSLNLGAIYRNSVHSIQPGEKNRERGPIFFCCCFCLKNTNNHIKNSVNLFPHKQKSVLSSTKITTTFFGG